MRTIGIRSIATGQRPQKARRPRKWHIWIADVHPRAGSIAHLHNLRDQLYQRAIHAWSRHLLVCAGNRGRGESLEEGPNSTFQSRMVSFAPRRNALILCAHADYPDLDRWALTFPVGTCATAAIAAAKELDSGALRGVAMFFSMWVVVAWLVVAPLTVKASWNGTAFVAPELAPTPAPAPAQECKV